MHNAILKNDLEAVLFLLSVHVDVNNRTRDSSQRTPLQLATVVGNDMMVRNLVSERGGAQVSNETEHKFVWRVFAKPWFKILTCHSYSLVLASMN